MHPYRIGLERAFFPNKEIKITENLFLNSLKKEIKFKIYDDNTGSEIIFFSERRIEETLSYEKTVLGKIKHLLTEDDWQTQLLGTDKISILQDVTPEYILEIYLEETKENKGLLTNFSFHIGEIVEKYSVWFKSFDGEFNHYESSELSKEGFNNIVKKYYEYFNTYENTKVSKTKEIRYKF